MTNKFRRSCIVRAAGLALALALPAAPAFSQAYPTKPVRIVVPLTPGSGADIVARILSKKLTEMWGQPVVVENKPGAGGQLGSREVLRAAPDGHTLLIQSASHAANPAIYKALPYDPLRDFIDVSLLSVTPYVMVSSSTGPFKTVKAVVDAAKAKPRGIFFASAGVGSSTHLTAELFNDVANVDLTHVPFKGSPDAITDVAAGNTAFYMAPLPTVAGMLKDGRVVPVAVSSQQRVASLPNVPTMAESGYPNFKAELWVGLWTPAGVPAPIIAKLSSDVTKALQSPEVREQYAASGNQARILSQPDFAKFVRSEIEVNRAIVKRANIQPE